MPRIITQNAIIENETFTGWNDPHEDGLMVKGDIIVSIDHCLFHRKDQLPTQADELLSVIDGAKLSGYRCTFGLSGKGVLIGTGDSNESDFKKGQSATFEESIFYGLSRRSVMVNSGKVTMKSCLISNFGMLPYFDDVKCYGSRATGEYAEIELIDCVYEQEGFIACIRRGTLIRNLLSGGGWWLAAFDEKGGKITARNCYKNRWWLHGISSEMSKAAAQELKMHLGQVCPKLP